MRQQLWLQYKTDVWLLLLLSVKGLWLKSVILNHVVSIAYIFTKCKLVTDKHYVRLQPCCDQEMTNVEICRNEKLSVFGLYNCPWHQIDPCQESVWTEKLCLLWRCWSDTHKCFQEIPALTYECTSPDGWYGMSHLAEQTAAWLALCRWDTCDILLHALHAWWIVVIQGLFGDRITCVYCRK